MKRILSTTLVALAITFATAHAKDSDATNTIGAHVQTGLFAEEVNRDFATATAAYESAIAQFDATRPLAATALFRLAEIHRRAGNTEEAEALYARVAREFHDQTELATLAAEYLPDGTPLTGPAADSEAAEIARLKELLKKSPDLFYARAENQETRLYNAIMEGKLQVVKFLISHGFDLSLLASSDENPLQLAIREGHQPIVEFLLEQGADVNSKDLNGSTPLSWAAVNGFLSIAELLLEKGADVNNTALLHSAIRSDGVQRIPLVQLLIEHGADVNAQDYNDRTPLHLAADQGYLRIVEILLEHSADVSAQNSYGATPLHSAVDSRSVNSVPMAELLLSHGADVNALTSKGRSPLDIVPAEFDKLAEFLRQRGGTEGKFHATISIIEPFEEERIVLWDRSEKMTLREALEKAGVEIDNIASGDVNFGGRMRLPSNIKSILKSAEDPEIENGTEITLHLNAQ